MCWDACVDTVSDVVEGSLKKDDLRGCCHAMLT